MANPLICDPAQKSSIETANGVEQLDYISDLVTSYQIKDIRESHVLGLHDLAVEGVFPCGGSYRDALSQVHIGGSNHVIPEPAFVPGHVLELLDYLNDHKRHEVSTLPRSLRALAIQLDSPIPGWQWTNIASTDIPDCVYRPRSNAPWRCYRAVTHLHAPR